VKLSDLSDKLSSQLRTMTDEADTAKLATLALDMGTGECKLLVLLHEGDGVIVLKELATSKIVQERDKKDSGHVHKTVDIAMSYTDQLGHKRLARRQTSGKISPPPLTTSPSGKSPDKRHETSLHDAMIEAFTDGLDKLDNEHRRTEFGDKFDLNSYQWVPGIIGATAWFRKLHVAGQESVLLFMSAIKDAIEETARSKLDVNLDMKIEPISSDVEAMHEQRAVEHACARAGQPPPDAVLSAGSGSMQFTSSAMHTSSAMQLVASVDLELKRGQDLIQESRTVPDRANAWEEMVRGALAKCDALQRYRKPSTAKKPGWKKLGKLLAKPRVMATLKLDLPVKGANASIDSGSRVVHLVGMSGFAYAAVSAKLMDKNDLTAPMKYLEVAKVITKLEEVGNDLKADDKDRANCRRLCVTLETFLKLLDSDKDNARMLFLRDCACHPFGTFTGKDAKFRTTWTAGWFIERVRRTGVDIEPYEPLSKKKRQERLAVAAFSGK